MWGLALDPPDWNVCQMRRLVRDLRWFWMSGAEVKCNLLVAKH